MIILGFWNEVSEHENILDLEVRGMLWRKKREYWGEERIRVYVWKSVHVKIINHQIACINSKSLERVRKFEMKRESIMR